MESGAIDNPLRGQNAAQMGKMKGGRYPSVRPKKGNVNKGANGRRKRHHAVGNEGLKREKRVCVVDLIWLQSSIGRRKASYVKEPKNRVPDRVRRYEKDRFKCNHKEEKRVKKRNQWWSEGNE